MTPNRLLIIDREADIYRARLAALFPEVAFQAAPTAAEAGSAIEEAQALFAFGSSLDDRLIAEPPDWNGCSFSRPAPTSCSVCARCVPELS